MARPSGRRCYAISILLIALATNCRKPDTLFHIPKRLKKETLSVQIAQAERNYSLQPGDIIELNVFANKGELMIDPNFELLKTIKKDINLSIRDQAYKVRGNGYVKLPLVGDVLVQGMRVSELEIYLEQFYESYYNEPFVLVRCISRRVVVLGALGGQVVPLPYEGATVLEVLASAGGIYAKGRAKRILLMRGELQNPEIYEINLSSISGMRQSIIPLQPGDVLYVVPYRRDFAQSVNYVSLMTQALTALFTLLWLLRGV